VLFVIFCHEDFLATKEHKDPKETNGRLRAADPTLMYNRRAVPQKRTQQNTPNLIGFIVDLIDLRLL
jgi:hypothetical protein